MVPDEALESIAPVHELYYHAVSKQLFVGNYKEGILIYDMGGTGKIISCQFPNHVEVNQIVALNAHELLVATGGKGVYKLDVNTYISEPYITADYSILSPPVPPFFPGNHCICPAVPALV